MKLHCKYTNFFSKGEERQATPTLAPEGSVEQENAQIHLRVIYIQDNFKIQFQKSDISQVNT